MDGKENCYHRVENLFSLNMFCRVYHYTFWQLSILLDLLLEELKSVFANFFWGENESGMKHYSETWKACCLPVKEGVLGLRSVEDTCKSLCYEGLVEPKGIASHSLWAELRRKKYEKYLSFVGGSTTWKRTMHVSGAAAESQILVGQVAGFRA